MIKPDSSTQRGQVSDHLIKKGSISGLEAFALYRVSSLTKVISVLRAQFAHDISSEWRQDNTGKRYKRYYLAAA